MVIAQYSMRNGYGGGPANPWVKRKDIVRAAEIAGPLAQDARQRETHMHDDHAPPAKDARR
jgi:hypothetical protein